MKRPASPRRATSTNESPATHGGPGEVRIISGQWRGRKLPVLNVTGLRPTTDRVKETLFNWLMQDVAGRAVLDCFSGSGSLAFEALSRHARSALMLELDGTAAKRLQQNLASLQCTQGVVQQVDCLQFLAKPAQQQFDLVFLDPPFRQQLLLPVCERLEQQGWLAADALIYTESEKELPVTSLPSTWELIKEKTAGQLCYRLWQRKV